MSDLFAQHAFDALLRRDEDDAREALTQVRTSGDLDRIRDAARRLDELAHQEIQDRADEGLAEMHAQREGVQAGGIYGPISFR